MAKGFDTFCPVRDFIPRTSIKDPHNLKLWCKVNKEMKQNGNTGDMIFKIPYLLAYIPQIFTLEPNHVVLTGTPAGISSVLETSSKGELTTLLESPLRLNILNS